MVVTLSVVNGISSSLNVFKTVAACVDAFCFVVVVVVVLVVIVDDDVDVDALVRGNFSVDCTVIVNCGFFVGCFVATVSIEVGFVVGFLVMGALLVD